MSGTSRPDRVEDVVKRLSPFTWDSAAAVGYEAAQELLNDVIGCYVALLHRERARPCRDPERMRLLRDRIAGCDERQRTLDPEDRPGIAAVRESYRAVLDGLRAELR